MPGLQEGKTRTNHIRKATIKIFFIACYYILLGVINLSIFTHFVTINDETSEVFEDYFACHSAGRVSGVDCGDPPNLRLQAFGTFVSVAIILEGLLPTVILILIVKYSCGGIKCHSRNTTKKKPSNPQNSFSKQISSPSCSYIKA